MHVPQMPVLQPKSSGEFANSPLLFGCRTGICGTCIVEAEGKDIPPPDDEERELLEVLAPDNPKARLACQLNVQCDMVLHPLE